MSNMGAPTLIKFTALLLPLLHGIYAITEDSGIDVLTPSKRSHPCIQRCRHYKIMYRRCECRPDGQASSNCHLKLRSSVKVKGLPSFEQVSTEQYVDDARHIGNSQTVVNTCTQGEANGIPAKRRPPKNVDRVDSRSKPKSIASRDFYSLEERASMKTIKQSARAPLKWKMFTHAIPWRCSRQHHRISATTCTTKTCFHGKTTMRPRWIPCVRATAVPRTFDGAKWFLATFKWLASSVASWRQELSRQQDNGRTTQMQKEMRLHQDVSLPSLLRQ